MVLVVSENQKHKSLVIIYIPLEIPVRELPSYLLLATIAVSRGHQVVIVDPNDIWLYIRVGLLKSGCYLIKNVNIPSISANTYQRFLKDGFDMYCQEQEPSILWGSFDKYLFNLSITREQMLPFKAVFSYGERDTRAYNAFFADRGEVFLNTGSPRVDIWSSKQFQRIRRNGSQRALQPYVLLVSNFGSLMGKRHLSESMRVCQEYELTDSFPQEENLIRFLEEDASVCLNVILAAKYLAMNKPDLRIVIRPHPFDRVDYWRNIFAKHPNAQVIGNTDSITPWIAGATAVIHNGCTSALESVLQGVPVISYGPDRTHSDLNIPNRLGIRARTLAELDQALQQVLDGQYHVAYQTQSEAILQPLVTTGGNAALEMVRIMEAKSQFPPERKLTQADVLKLRLVRHGKNVIDRLRRLVNYKAPAANSYVLEAQQIRSEIAGMAEVMGLPLPKVRMIGKTGLLIEQE